LFRLTIRAERNDGADFFDEAGEHGSRIAMPAGGSKPIANGKTEARRERRSGSVPAEQKDVIRNSESGEVRENFGVVFAQEFPQ
jgi:hypothetical protein